MRLGIGLPSFRGNDIEPGEVLHWAERAEQTGFDAVAVHERPDHEAWEPLATLAAVAAVTGRVRLATAAVLLPARDEGLLVKQAAVIDRLSGGRLDLGVAVGARPRDFEALGRPFAGRGRTFERQLAHLETLWAAAVASDADADHLGPAPWQRPRPRLWVGGYTPAAIDRAVRWGDAYIFGAPPLALMAERIPLIRQRAAEAGRSSFEIGGLAYVLPSSDPAEAAEAEATLRRYYGTLARPFEQMVATGDSAGLGRTVAAYRQAGLDVLHLIPLGRSIEQIDRLAELQAVAAG